jgi:hypothetical protein
MLNTLSIFNRVQHWQSDALTTRLDLIHMCSVQSTAQFCKNEKDPPENQKMKTTWFASGINPALDHVALQTTWFRKRLARHRAVLSYSADGVDDSEERGGGGGGGFGETKIAQNFRKIILIL